MGGQGNDILYGGFGINTLVGGDVDDADMNDIKNPLTWNKAIPDGTTGDIFVFATGEGTNSYFNTNGIADFTDEYDRISFYSGGDYQTTPFGDNLLIAQPFAFGMSPYTYVQDVITGNYLFIVDGTPTLNDEDVYDFSA